MQGPYRHAGTLCVCAQAFMIQRLIVLMYPGLDSIMWEGLLAQTTPCYFLKKCAISADLSTLTVSQ